MKSYIHITRFPYEEPHVLMLGVVASNGRQRGEITIYTVPEDLVEVSRRLRDFPQSRGEAVVWELGSAQPGDRFGFYFRMRLIPLGRLGHFAVEVQYNNNGEAPHRASGEFSIEGIVTADLDRLASLLEVFSEMRHQALIWSVNEGELRIDA